MQVFRITLTKYTDTLFASGYAARWNSKGVKVIYSAGSRSLACLENIVHRSSRGLKSSFSTMVIDIPNHVKVQTIAQKELPKGWHETSLVAHKLSRVVGDEWVSSQNTCVLKVPSALINEEYNYIINPQHNSFKKIKIKKVSSFQFDKRLF